MKKIISIIICVSMILCMTNITYAETTIDFDNIINGEISENNEQNEYLFELSEAGILNIYLYSQDMSSVDLKLFDDRGQELWMEYVWSDSGAKHLSINRMVALTAGAYTFEIIYSYGGYGTYELELSLDTIEETIPEEQGGSNNTFDMADVIELDEAYIGQLGINDSTDIYMLTLDETVGFDWILEAKDISNLKLEIYDKHGQRIWYSDPIWEYASKQLFFNEPLALNSGTYYLLISVISENGSYEFVLLSDDKRESFYEDDTTNDNTYKTANQIEFDTEYTGILAINDETDNYMFEVYEDGKYELNFMFGRLRGADLEFYREGTGVISSANPWWGTDPKENTHTDILELERGKYCFTISVYGGYGTYEFTIKTLNEVVPDIPAEPDEPDIPYEPDEPLEPDPLDNELTSFNSKVSEWAKEEVEEAYENYLIPETIVGEDLTEYIDREEFAAIAVKLYEELSGTIAPKGGIPFVDTYGSLNSTYIKKAYALGITNGTSKYEFSPYMSITREQLATMLCRTIKKYSFDGWTLENDDEYYLDTSGVSRFADDNEISDYAKPSVYYMAKFGIIKGVDDSHFAPKNLTSWQEATGYATATREQAILMSLRIFRVSDMW